MITRIELENFMSHRRTVIEPARGLTVLVGRGAYYERSRKRLMNGSIGSADGQRGNGSEMAQMAHSQTGPSVKPGRENRRIRNAPQTRRSVGHSSANKGGRKPRLIKRHMNGTKTHPALSRSKKRGKKK